MVPVAMSHRQAARRRLMGRLRRTYALAGSPSMPGTTAFFRLSRGRWISGMPKGVCSMARPCSRLKTLGTLWQMVLLLWGSRSGSVSLWCAWKLSREAWRTVLGSLVRPPSVVCTAWMVRHPVSCSMRLTHRRDLHGVLFLRTFRFLGGGCHAVGVPLMELVAASC